MYEAGWGKKLNYVVAIAVDHCLDVTWRYTRQGATGESFMKRRRQVASSEDVSDTLIQQFCQRLMASLSPKARDDLQGRLDREKRVLAAYKEATTWSTATYGQGRISGSLEWRLARREAGKRIKDTTKTPDEERKDASKITSYTIETFLPRTSTKVSIALDAHPQNPRAGIVVSGTPCAVGQHLSLSVVIVDDHCLGCILQSRGFSSLDDLVDFIETVPANRIVTVHGRLEKEKISTEASQKIVKLLPKIRINAIEDGILYLGQKNATPEWSFCASFQECPDGYRVTTEETSRDISLRTLRGVQPASVLGRLPGEWVDASEAEKRQAFLAYNDAKCSGYCTKPGMPIYLLSETAFPLQSASASDEVEWNTFLWWPTPMVPESDHGIVDKSSAENSGPAVQVPVDVGFFQGLLGSTLQIKSGVMATEDVLQNKRLVGLYFSAAWCMVCTYYALLHCPLHFDLCLTNALALSKFMSALPTILTCIGGNV